MSRASSSKVPGKRASEPCPCGHPLNHVDCCGRYHAGVAHLQAPDPESLMRSRYAAYVKDVCAYLLDTWHTDNSPDGIDPPERGLKWLGLTILKTTLTGPDTGKVLFVARYKVGGRAHRLAEASRFVREQGRWFYLDPCPGGEAPGVPSA